MQFTCLAQVISAQFFKFTVCPGCRKPARFLSDCVTANSGDPQYIIAEARRQCNRKYALNYVLRAAGKYFIIGSVSSFLCSKREKGVRHNNGGPAYCS